MTAQLTERVPELTLGWRIRMAMESAKVSREDMAKAIGISPAQLSRITRDQHDVRRAYLKTIADETHVSFEWLANGTGSPTPGPGITNDPGDTDARIAALASRRRGGRGARDTGLYLASLGLAA